MSRLTDLMAQAKAEDPRLGADLDHAQRVVMLEIDVLAARTLGLTLAELPLIFRAQFPVMQGYERDIWLDINGRWVFTISKGLVDVGLPRKGAAKTPKSRIRTPEGKVREGNLAWEYLYKESQWPVPDDTLPGDPLPVERRYVASFARANREGDCRNVWAFFAAEQGPSGVAT